MTVLIDADLWSLTLDKADFVCIAIAGVAGGGYLYTKVILADMNLAVT